MKDIIRLKDYNGDDAVVDSFFLESEINEESSSYKFNSKISGLDKLLEGFEAGELIALSGPRKSGKTLLAQTLTYSFNEQDIMPLWFNFELTLRQFFARFTKGLPWFAAPKQLRVAAMDWIEEKIAEGIAKFGIQVVFIDHLHFLFDMEKGKNASIEIGQIIRKLKLIAISYNIVIFILCHLKKVDLGKEPSDVDFRDSSLIASESDAGILIWRNPKRKEQNIIKVCYSRRTGVFNEKCVVEKIDGLLREVDRRHVPED